MTLHFPHLPHICMYCIVCMYVCAGEEEELAREPRASLSFLERDITIKLAPSRNVDATAKRNEHAYNAPQVSPTK